MQSVVVAVVLSVCGFAHNAHAHADAIGYRNQYQRRHRRGSASAPSVLMVFSQYTDMPATSEQEKNGVTPDKTGWYLPEAAHPYYVFQEAGIEMVFVSPEGGDAPCDVGSLKSFTDEESLQFKAEVMQNNGTTLATVRLSELPKPASSYDAILYVGGHGAMWDFPENEGQNKAAAAIYENGGVVASVCHGTAGLVNVRLSDETHLVQGRLVTGFTNSEDDAIGASEVLPYMLETVLKERGGKFVSVKDWGTNSVVDGRLLSGQNPQSAGALAEDMVAALSRRRRY